MRSLIILAILFVVTSAIVIGIGCLWGLLLHAMIPRVDLGIGILIGLVATGLSLRLFEKFASLMRGYELDDLDDDGDITLDPAGPVIVLDPFEPPPPRPRTRRKKRKS